MLVNEYKLYASIQFKKVRKMQNLGNVYIWGSPFVMSRTDAQNGVDIIACTKPHALPFPPGLPGLRACSEPNTV
jgi:hypothetical protein